MHTENINEFCYLGNVITADNKCLLEIKRILLHNKHTGFNKHSETTKSSSKSWFSVIFRSFLIDKYCLIKKFEI